MTRDTANRPWGIAMGLYLMGIFMGAIDTGIITPARTVIQTQTGVDEATGIWMITIYTLAYAAAIPVMGKLADRNGRKPVYLVSIGLFGLGSLLCGLSRDVGSFEMLIAARALQAIGGGGILPIATADIGAAVPREKRGMALGLVGAVYGIANVFGASAGSLVLDIAGTENWQWIFFINVPISLGIVLAGWFWLPNRRADEVAPIDALGSLLLVTMILSLLWGVRSLDFFDVASSITSTEVWPWLALFVLLIPMFVLVERRAPDPVLNLRYFTDRGIALTLVLSLLSGVILMGVVFVPQFAENSLKLPSGSGGYLVIALGLASGIGAPLSGRLTDRFGPRAVLGLGAAISLVAAIVIILWAIPQPSMTSVLVGLCLIGLGLGFIVGSPLNYMMLERTHEDDASSALGTLSLVRAIGTTLAPALMVGFLANAGASLQDTVADELPTTVTVPALPHAAELTTTLERWEADPDLAERIGSVDTSYLQRTSIDIGSLGDANPTDPNGGQGLPDDLVELLRTADVTTIVERTKVVATRVFADQAPGRVAEIEAGVQSGIDGLATGLEEMDEVAAEMTSGLAEMDASLAEMTSGLAEMDANLRRMGTGIAEMGEALTGLDAGVAGMRRGVSGLDEAITGMDAGLAEQLTALAGAEQVPEAARTPEVQAQIDALQASVAELEAQRDGAAGERAALQSELGQAQEQRARLAGERSGLQAGRRELAAARAELAKGREELTAARAELAAGREELLSSRAELETTRDQLIELRSGVPAAFAQAEADYLAEIDERAPRIEAAFQAGLNTGFRDLYLLFAGACALTLLALAFVGRPPGRADGTTAAAAGSEPDTASYATAEAA